MPPTKPRNCEKSLPVKSNGTAPKFSLFKSLPLSNSADEYAISLEFGTYLTADTFHVFKFKRSKVKVTA